MKKIKRFYKTLLANTKLSTLDNNDIGIIKISNPLYVKSIITNFNKNLANMNISSRDMREKILITTYYLIYYKDLL